MTIGVWLFVTAASAASVASVASFTDVATVGYATMNGGYVSSLAQSSPRKAINNTIDSTKGGAGGPVTTVDTFKALRTALRTDEPKIVVVTGKIEQSGKINVGSHTSLIGIDGAELIGTGLNIYDKKNIIIRNLKISKVPSKNGDAIGARLTTNLWIDHVDVSSDKTKGKNFYDGLIDLTRGVDFTTVSNSYIHDHFKGCLLGHSDKNADQDKGKLRVTWHGNLWKNIDSRGPSLRFGTNHIFDNLYINVPNGINVRQGAQVLVERNTFKNSKRPLYSVDNLGAAVVRNNHWGNFKRTIVNGTLQSIPYVYTAAGTAGVEKTAGATLEFL